MVNLKVKDDSSNFDLPSKVIDNEQTNISILLVDDQNSIRESLHVSLESKPGLKIIAKAADGQTAISQVDIFRPDIALIDIEMPGMNGLEATKIIKKRFSNTKVIILSSYDDDEYVNQALKAGANGYLLKTTPTSEIVDAIRYVHKGYLQLGPGLFKKFNPEKIIKQDSSKGQQIVEYESKNLTISEPNENEREKHHQELIQNPGINSRTSHSLTKTKSLKPDRNEWSSLTKELIETLPQVWTRGLLYLLMVLVGIVLPWAMLSKVDETGSARGKLEPQEKVFTVDAPVAGTVEKVFVTEGQLVKSQQPLLSLESKPVESELQQVQTKLEGQQKELAQIKLLKNQLVLTINTQKQQNTAQLFEKRAQLDQAKQDIQHSKIDKHLAEKAYDEAKKEVNRYVEAKDQGIVSEIQVVEKENSVRERERLLEQANSDIEQAQFRLIEQEKSYQGLIYSGEIAVFRSEEQLKEIEKQIVTLNSQIKENKSQVDSLKYQLKQRIVRAPASGFIFQLPVQKTGSVIEPGGLVAEIAPEQSSLVLKAQMPPTESGSLDPGMSVKLKFDAYPFQDFGIVEGKLISISPTTKVIDTEQGKVERYELEIKLDQDYIQAKNKRVALRPGQTAIAEVIVRQRRLIDFVLDPFKKLNKNGLEL